LANFAFRSLFLSSFALALVPRNAVASDPATPAPDAPVVPPQTQAAPPPAVPAPNAPPRTVVSDVEVRWDATPDQKQVNLGEFERLLAEYGFETNECPSARAGFKGWIRSRGYPVPVDKNGTLAAEAVALEQEYCKIPEDNAIVFQAILTLSVEPLQQNRKRATLELRSLNPKTARTLRGGYSHKVGQVEEWNQVMNAAMARTVRGKDDETAILIKAPLEARVGDTVDIDGSETWDVDGDAFILHWSVLTEGCWDGARTVPVDGGCPARTTRVTQAIQNSAGETKYWRTFSAPLVGDYQIAVHSTIGQHDSPPVVRSVRVSPRRPHSIFWRLSDLALPANFIASGAPKQPTYFVRVGYQQRVDARVGLLGAFEEVHLSGFLFTMNPPADFAKFDTGGTGVGLEASARTLTNDGRLALVSGLLGAGGFLIARRSDIERVEPVWTVQTNLLLYYAAGPNYTNEPSRFCGRMCFDFNVGPMLAYWQDQTTGKKALVGGIEFGTSVAF
jgi:hypothetical protein